MYFNENINESFLDDFKKTYVNRLALVFGYSRSELIKINRFFLYAKKIQKFKQDFKKYYKISKKLEGKILFLIKDMEQDYRKKKYRIYEFKIFSRYYGK